MSVKAAMPAVAGPHEKLLIGRDAHTSVVSGLILSGGEPVWVEPLWDVERRLAHPPSAAAFEEAFAAHPGRRIGMQLTPADDRETTGELLSALKEPARSAPELGEAPRVAVPVPAELRMEQAMLPRDAFFGPAEAVSLGAADGRIAAEMITP